MSPFYRDEHLYVDLSHELVTVDGQVLTLTQKEYCLLLLLVRHAGKTLPRTTFEMRSGGMSLVCSHAKWISTSAGYGKN